MFTPKQLFLRASGVACTLAFLGAPLQADGPYRNRDNKSARDSGEPTYPIPYQLPTEAEITDTLGRVRGFLESVTPTRIVDRKTGREITDFSTPVVDAAVARSEAEFSLLAYEMGVVHAGMLRATEVTGDPAFAAYTGRHLKFIAERLPYFRAQAEKFGVDRSPVRNLLEPRSLDDCGSMCTALIRARLAKIGPDLKSVIDNWSDYVAHKQFRFAASKGAVGQLTKALSNEWASHGVQVNAIAPGYMRTDNTAALQSDPVRSREILHRIPANRWGEPEDLEGAIVFLASSASNYLSGHVMAVDGGWCGR